MINISPSSPFNQPDMENEYENSDVNLNKQTTAELLKKSAQLKIKNAQVMDKLEELKKKTDNLLNPKNNDPTER